jgi:hypothetical protein
MGILAGWILRRVSVGSRAQVEKHEQPTTPLYRAAKIKFPGKFENLPGISPDANPCERARL